jgi:DNA modification methylase
MWELFEGDCLEIMPTLPDKSVDMILCDLPYGTTACKWDSVIPLEFLWTQYKRLIKDKGAIVLTACQPFTSALVMSNLEMFRYSLVWEKTTVTGFLNAKRMPMRKHEDILVFYSSVPTYNPIKTMGHIRKTSTAAHRQNCKRAEVYRDYGLATYDSTERYPTSILQFKTDKQISSLHPTQKPVALFEYLIKTYTNPGDTILDNCAGSGTTAIAAEQCGRNSIVIEREPKYCEIIRKRMADFESARQGCLSF